MLARQFFVQAMGLVVTLLGQIDIVLQQALVQRFFAALFLDVLSELFNFRFAWRPVDFVRGNGGRNGENDEGQGNSDMITHDCFLRESD